MDGRTKTCFISGKGIKRKTFVVDAGDLCVGRLASVVATILQGKGKVYFAPFINCGDNVVVVNCSKAFMTGKKMTGGKIYISYTGYPGGQKMKTFQDVMAKDSTKIIMHAVKGMLPKNRRGRDLFMHLECYEGEKKNMVIDGENIVKLDLNKYARN